MDFGYKSLIATVLVCAAWCKTRSSNLADDKAKADSSIVVNPEKDSASSPSIYNPDFTGSSSNQSLQTSENYDKDAFDWTQTSEGKEIVSAWNKAMDKQGTYYDLNRDDIYALIELSRKNRTLGALRSVATSYTFSAEDLILMKPDEKAKRLAEAAKAYCLGKLNSCFHYVKGTTMSEEPFVYMEGKHAEEAIDWLDKNPNVVGILADFSNLDKIVEGTTVVFEKNQTPSGHIYTSVVGNDSATYMSPDGTEYTYMQKEESSDHRQKSNLTGVRGRSGKYYGQPHAYIPKEVEVGFQTFVNITTQIAKENCSGMFVTPRDACKTADKIAEESGILSQKLIDIARFEFPTFKNTQIADDGYLSPTKVHISKNYTAKAHRKRSPAKKYAHYTARSNTNNGRM